MIRLTNLADYAIVLMVELARSSDRLNATDLAGITRLPVPTVSKILGLLGRAGLLKSHRGLKGGFSLIQAPEDISVAAIIEAVDGPIALVNCVDSSTAGCSIESLCSMRTNWAFLNQQVRNTFAAVSLAQMSQGAPSALMEKFEQKDLEGVSS